MQHKGLAAQHGAHLLIWETRALFQPRPVYIHLIDPLDGALARTKSDKKLQCLMCQGLGVYLSEGDVGPDKGALVLGPRTLGGRGYFICLLANKMSQALFQQLALAEF